MKILRELCSVPTAPYAEHSVVRYVERFVAARRKLKLQRDEFGNLLITFRDAPRTPRIVFVAHMDHPGFVAERMQNPTTLHARFHGGVLSEYLIGTKVIFFDADREIHGQVISTEPDAQRSAYPSSAIIRVNENVARGSPGMFDLGESRLRGEKFFSRVCDDLAGVAAALTMLDQLHRSAKPQAAAVLLTRAEEDGFVGPVAAAAKLSLLKKSDRIISIECSAKQPYAKQGDGVILRVGDFTSVFDSSLMFFLRLQAQEIASKDRAFKFQRSLMPGGTCEATVFDVYGFQVGGVCVPLGNYHNMNRAKKKLAAEFVNINDWLSMVKLFIAVTKNADKFDGTLGPLKSKLEKRFNLQKKYL